LTPELSHQTLNRKGTKIKEKDHEEKRRE